MEAGDNSGSAATSEQPVHEPRAQFPSQVSNTAANTATPNRDTSSAVGRANPIARAIGVMMEPRQFCEQTEPQNGYTCQPFRSNPVPQIDVARGSAGPEPRLTSLGEKYAFCEHAYSSGIHRVERQDRSAHAGVSVNSCGEGEGEREDSAAPEVKPVRYC